MVISLVGMVALSKYLSQIPYLKNVVPANPTADDVAIDDPYDQLASRSDDTRHADISCNANTTVANCSVAQQDDLGDVSQTVTYHQSTAREIG